MVSCSDFDIKERGTANYASFNLYVVSGYDVDNEVFGYDSLYISDLDIKVYAERKIIPQLSKDLYSTVIYFGSKDSINRNYGFFVGDSTRKPCLFQVKDDTIITQVFEHLRKGPVPDFSLDLNGQINLAPKRSQNIRQTCRFSNWTCDLNLLTTNLTVKNDVTLTGNTGHRIRIEDGVTVTLNNAAVYNSFVCNGNATVVLAPDSKNIVRVNTYYTHGFMNGGQGTTLTIQGSGELTADMSGDRDRAGIGGNAGDIIIKGGTIIAKGGNGGAGIGASRASTTGNIIITGGNITAIGGSYGSGIGSGQYWSYSTGDVPSRCGNIVITGGTVVAQGGSYGAGIGSGNKSECGTVTIRNSVTSITASKGSGQAESIGAGEGGSCGTVTIEDGAVVACN